MAATKSSQEIIDEFWKTHISTGNPTRASAVLPRNVYAERVGRQVPRGVTAAESVEASYWIAKTHCKEKVAQIIKECRMINQKYSDPYFDLNFRDTCLNPLKAKPPKPDSGNTAGPSGVVYDVTQNGGSAGNLVIFNQLQAPPSSPCTLNPPSVKRVGDIFDNPRFFVDGANAKDIRQGYDGDCWFLSALTTLCNLDETQQLVRRICVAQDQDVGVYGFVLYRDGEWTSVIIDDKLYLRKPDYEDTDEQVRSTWEDNRVRVNSEEEYRKEFQSNSRALYYAQSTHPDETWVPLIEKAFAKAHGDYSAIEAGSVGEGVEDLTGGISTTILPTDILSKEKFWTEGLLKVNEDFLFGCGTDNWDDPFQKGRDGIHAGHAYSILRAVNYKGERLLMMKNPWGQSEWNGPWSDGSAQWTAESIKDLGHTFGDDGIFWIRYEDMLRKYAVIWRTRLFSKEWKVTQQWTSLTVPWAGEYQEAKFKVVIAKTAPTVIVLSQLDDRYFRGLTGQYSFQLSFRVHRAGEEDYIMRTFGEAEEDRSVSAELTLEAGTYEVRLKLLAFRDSDRDKVEDVVKDNWLDRREKLLQIGLSYDLAHAKAQVKETSEKAKEEPTAAVSKVTIATAEAAETVSALPTEPAKTEPTKTESTKTEPAKTEPAKTEPAEDQPAKSSDHTEGKSSAPLDTVATSEMGDPEPDKKADEKADDKKGSDEDEKADAAWGAVAVVGLRVYCRDADATIEIVRPKATVTAEEKKVVKLDVDDPARDAAEGAQVKVKEVEKAKGEGSGEGGVKEDGKKIDVKSEDPAIKGATDLAKEEVAK